MGFRHFNSSNQIDQKNPFCPEIENGIGNKISPGLYSFYPVNGTHHSCDPGSIGGFYLHPIEFKGIVPTRERRHDDVNYSGTYAPAWVPFG